MPQHSATPRKRDGARVDLTPTYDKGGVDVQAGGVALNMVQSGHHLTDGRWVLGLGGQRVTHADDAQAPPSQHPQVPTKLLFTAPDEGTTVHPDDNREAGVGPHHPTRDVHVEKGARARVVALVEKGDDIRRGIVHLAGGALLRSLFERVPQ